MAVQVGAVRLGQRGCWRCAARLLGVLLSIRVARIGERGQQLGNKGGKQLKKMSAIAVPVSVRAKPGYSGQTPAAGPQWLPTEQHMEVA